MKTLITSQNSLLTILRSRFTSILVALTLGAFALASVPTAFGVVPAPDGGYPGGNTAEGDNALFSLTNRREQYRRRSGCAFQQHNWQQQHG
mgnify:CR=1 FL=1